MLGFLSPHYLQRHLLLHIFTSEVPVWQVAVEERFRHIPVMPTENIPALTLSSPYSRQTPVALISP